MPVMFRRGAGFRSLTASCPRIATGGGQVTAGLSCATPSAGASNAAPSTPAVNIITRYSIGTPSGWLRLELVLQAELHDARIVRRQDLSERRTAQGRVRILRPQPVERIERLDARLDPLRGEEPE